jgi:DNA invertase Pin-like site-specific DNA recombinase
LTARRLPASCNSILAALAEFERGRIRERVKAGRQRARAQGKEQIFAAGLCTAGHPQLLCSYRRDWKDVGRMAASIRARDGGRR